MHCSGLLVDKTAHVLERYSGTFCPVLLICSSGPGGIKPINASGKSCINLLNEYSCSDISMAFSD